MTNEIYPTFSDIAKMAFPSKYPLQIYAGAILYLYGTRDRIKRINLMVCLYTIDGTVVKKEPGFCVTSCPGTVVKHKKKRKS
jgi:hypothetical protein